MTVLAVCFLLFFCPGHAHAPHHRHVTKSCAEIIKKYDGVDRDAFVRTFPPARQHHVLVCLGD